LKLTRGDLAFRVNFSTVVSETGEIHDRRAGRTLSTSEAEALADSIMKIKMPFPFEFIPTKQHNAVLVFRGGFSEDITGNDITYIQGKTNIHDKIRDCKPLDDTENSQYTCNVLNEFIERVHELLEHHPINKERMRKGLLPANYILLRGPGIEAPKLKLYRKWVSAAYTPLEIGFSKVSGMETLNFDYPKLSDFDSYANSYEALRRACKFAMTIIRSYSRKYEYAYIHIKETDLPGHDNKPVEKKLMIEYIDSTLFHFLRKFVPPNNIRMVVTGDHSTPCKNKGHSANPVPVLFYNNSVIRERGFNEKEARRGSLGKIMGKDLLEKVGFVK
jgi:2,3-bisphosphoglycerate-independent phosphoglycerate mutase